MPNQTEDIFKIAMIASILLIIVIGYFIFSFVRQQRKMMKWQQSRIAAEIQTLESDRKRIAGDLHDELGPLLSAVKLQMNYIELPIESDQQIIKKSSNQIDEIIKRFREISFNLLPNTLVRKGLINATQEYIYKVEELHQLKIEFENKNVERLMPEREVNLYRIIQELVHNTVKHAQASLLKINLSQKDNLLTLQTIDNGVGFVYDEKKEIQSGIGLLSVQSRVEILKGNLTVNSKLNNGTIYTITIPVKL